MSLNSPALSLGNSGSKTRLAPWRAFSEPLLPGSLRSLGYILVACQIIRPTVFGYGTRYSTGLPHGVTVRNRPTIIRLFRWLILHGAQYNFTQRYFFNAPKPTRKWRQLPPLFQYDYHHHHHHHHSRVAIEAVVSDHHHDNGEQQSSEDLRVCHSVYFLSSPSATRPEVIIA